MLQYVDVGFYLWNLRKSFGIFNLLVFMINRWFMDRLVFRLHLLRLEGLCVEKKMPFFKECHLSLWFCPNLLPGYCFI